VLRQAGVEILAVLTVVDREEGGTPHLLAAGVPQVIALVTARELLSLHAAG